MDRDTVIVIPAYEPEGRLVDFVGDLREVGYEYIVVVDDGSGVDYRSIFSSIELMDIVVLRHMRNLGKGRALCTAFLYIKNRLGESVNIITADADGQHLVKDIKKVEKKLKENPVDLVLGVRDFTSENVPFKSKKGNEITRKFFKLTTGVDCPDTQTGLRGIPGSMLEFALGVYGDRYEYEMNFLTEAAQRYHFSYVPITTVYENNNACSHFRPVMDSLRIYGRPVRFLLSSLTSSGVDLLLFYLLTVFLQYPHGKQIIIATIIARVCSGVVNFEMNKHFSFKSKGKAHKEGARYFVLFVGQMMLSAGGVSIVSAVLPNPFAKIIVDTLLFVLSYIIQKQWVFAKEIKGESYEKSAVSINS
ncbi:MAG: bifunctional glycosyltransferase family 2/GtrA family protein [Lachnospiraceae bacterium]|nr:bifunctional glycosyltransferase family 2/GtrA family protein [Lachnospiraceae bacterium]